MKLTKFIIALLTIGIASECYAWQWLGIQGTSTMIAEVGGTKDWAAGIHYASHSCYTVDVYASGSYDTYNLEGYLTYSRMVPTEYVGELEWYEYGYSFEYHSIPSEEPSMYCPYVDIRLNEPVVDGGYNYESYHDEVCHGWGQWQNN